MPIPTPPRLDLAGVRAAYDTVAGTYAAEIPDTRAESSLDLAMVDAFVEAVGAGTGTGTVAVGPVLDAGCGAGRMSRYLADRGCLVEGVDLSGGMVAMARRDHPDLPFVVGALAELPFADGRFAGVLLWYSTIHTPPAAQAPIFAETARVLRPGGHVLVGFQCGEGARDASPSYRRFGHAVVLERHLSTPDEVAAHLEAVGLTVVCRMERQAQGRERDGQAVLLARCG